MQHWWCLWTCNIIATKKCSHWCSLWTVRCLQHWFSLLVYFLITMKQWSCLWVQDDLEALMQLVGLGKLAAFIQPVGLGSCCSISPGCKFLFTLQHWFIQPVNVNYLPAMDSPLGRRLPFFDKASHLWFPSVPFPFSLISPWWLP